MAKQLKIINLTDNSFSDANYWLNAIKNDILQKKLEDIAQSADYLDIGAEASNPLASQIDTTTEWSRLMTFLDIYRQNSQLPPLSIDTRKASIVQNMIQQQIYPHIVNDISGWQDPDILAVYLQLLEHVPEAKIVLMHHRGLPPSHTPDLELTDVSSLLAEVHIYFEEKLTAFERATGLTASQHVILDFGLGFGKNILENIALTHHIPAFRRTYNMDMLYGCSRKRFVRAIYGSADLDLGTDAFNQLATSLGATHIRTH